MVVSRRNNLKREDWNELWKFSGLMTFIFYYDFLATYVLLQNYKTDTKMIDTLRHLDTGSRISWRSFSN